MRKSTIDLSVIKDKIIALKGESVKLLINRGRRKIEKYNATIGDIYPSVFTVTIHSDIVKNPQTFSYCDVLCGDVKISSK